MTFADKQHKCVNTLPNTWIFISVRYCTSAVHNHITFRSAINCLNFSTFCLIDKRCVNTEWHDCNQSINMYIAPVFQVLVPNPSLCYTTVVGLPWYQVSIWKSDSGCDDGIWDGVHIKIHQWQWLLQVGKYGLTSQPLLQTYQELI